MNDDLILRKPYKANFPSWWDNIRLRSINATSRENGLLGCLQTDEENAITYGEEGYHPLEKPEPLAGNASAATTAKYNADLAAYLEEVKAKKVFFTLMYGSFDAYLKKVVKPTSPKTVISLTLEEIGGALIKKFKAADSLELLTMTRSLTSEIYTSGDDIEDFLMRMGDTFDFLAANEQPVSEVAQVVAAAKALEECGRFTDAISRFYREHTEPAEFTYSNFCLDIIAATKQPSSHTLKSAGFAAAVLPVTTGSVQTMISEAIAAAITDKRDRNKKQQGGKQQGGKQHATTGTHGRPDSIFYCWSCGYNSLHSSKWCNSKKVGHQDAATHREKMGGSTKCDAM